MIEFLPPSYRFGPRAQPAMDATIESYGAQDVNQCFNGTALGERPWCWNCGSSTQLAFFCGRDNGPCKAMGVMLKLERALHHLQFYTVGITEHMAETVELLERRFPHFFAGGTRKYLNQPEMKVTPKDARVVPPNEETRRKIEYLTRYDMQLYEAAKEKFWRDLTACRAAAG
jgi:hypothetical protein